jgi:hypothetical protein
MNGGLTYKDIDAMKADRARLDLLEAILPGLRVAIDHLRSTLKNQPITRAAHESPEKYR